MVMPFEKTLREVALFSLQKRSLWEDPLTACQYLRGEEDRARLLADMHSRMMRDSE